MYILNTPRSSFATFSLPGNKLFWDTVLDQSQAFSYTTANSGKGGPFGAQLWLYNDRTEHYLLVDGSHGLEDSNSVLLKGIASAHAEAENLSLEKKIRIINFLQSNFDQDWYIIQVSSSESCPSCRSRQILFFQELFNLKLIDRNRFFVAFKSTYEQTKADAGFNDIAYDQTFRFILKLNILDSQYGLFSLDKTFKDKSFIEEKIKSSELIYNKISLVPLTSLPNNIAELFYEFGDTPAAIVVQSDNRILSACRDTRDHMVSGINIADNTCMVSALHEASTKARKKGKFSSWNMEGAILYTNISDIGPLAYSESLWYNLSEIRVVQEFTSNNIDIKAQELPGTTNRELFKQVCEEYNTPLSPIKVCHLGDPHLPSPAHLLWKARLSLERLENMQNNRIQELKSIGIDEFSLLDGTKYSLQDFILSSAQHSDYNGKIKI